MVNCERVSATLRCQPLSHCAPLTQTFRLLPAPGYGAGFRVVVLRLAGYSSPPAAPARRARRAEVARWRTDMRPPGAPGGAVRALIPSQGKWPRPQRSIKQHQPTPYHPKSPARKRDCRCQTMRKSTLRSARTTDARKTQRKSPTTSRAKRPRLREVYFPAR